MAVCFVVTAKCLGRKDLDCASTTISSLVLLRVDENLLIEGVHGWIVVNIRPPKAGEAGACHTSSRTTTTTTV